MFLFVAGCVIMVMSIFQFWLRRRPEVRTCSKRDVDYARYTEDVEYRRQVRALMSLRMRTQSRWILLVLAVFCFVAAIRG